jgi:GNAT superfamily N-acetyltransferase
MTAGLAEKDLVHIIETTFYEDMTALCTSLPGSFLRREPDMLIYASGIPFGLVNGVLGPRFGSRMIAKRTEVAMAHFERTKLPMMWILGPSSAPKHLERALLKRGMIKGEVMPGMAIDLKDVKREPLPSGLRIRRVNDMESLRICCRTVSEGFEVPQEVRERFSGLLENFDIGPTRRMFLGLLNGRPASSSVLVLHEEAAAIYCVATVPEARGKGIGTAITRETLLAAKDEGHEVAVLEASAMGLPVYRRMGFRELCHFRTLTWSP